MALDPAPNAAPAEKSVKAGPGASVREVLLSEAAFARCSRAQLARVLPRVEDRTVAAGETVLVAGNEATQAYLIAEGEFEVSDEHGGRQILSDGFLGEETAIGMHSYVGTAVATRPSRVLALPADVVWSLAENRAVRQCMLASFQRRLTGRGELHGGRAEASSASLESIRIVIGWIVTIAVPLLLFVEFRESSTLPTPQALYLLCVLGCVVSMWVFRLLADFVPALFALLAIILLDLVPVEVTLSGFASDSFFMAMSILGLSIVITTSGLSYRFLLWLLRVGPASRLWYNLSLFLTGIVLTPLVPTANGRVAIVTPLLNDLLGQFDRETRNAEAARLGISVIGGVSLLSAVFASSKSINFLIHGMLPVQEQAQFSWLYWLYAASICGAILMVLHVAAAMLVFPRAGRPRVSKALVREQLGILGRMRAGEWAGLAGIAILLLSFLTASIHQIAVPWVALSVLFIFLMFGFVSKREFRQNIDWGFLVFLGSLIGLASAMNATGLNAWIALQLGWLQGLMTEDFPLFVLMLAGAIFLVRMALPINATVIIFATLLISTAVQVGVNAWLVGFIVMLLAESFVWPFQASYFLQFTSIADGSADVNQPRALVFQLLMFLFKLVAIYASFPFWREIGVL